MKYKRFNIAKPEKYTKDGQEKTHWHNIGSIVEFTKDDGSISRIMEIPAISLKGNIFEQKPREDQNNQSIENPPTNDGGEISDEQGEPLPF